PRSLVATDLTLDSRNVMPGAAFLACRGQRSHGLGFAAQAVERGARAVIYEPADGVTVPDFGSAIFVAPVEHLTRHVGVIADRFFGRPSQALTIAGITGTNGKTTSAWLLAQALAALGRRCAYAGTLGFGVPPALRASALTTPDAVTLHRELAQLRAEGAECVAMEVSSHALDQERVTGVRFHTAVFTNLTRDHLDYHGSMAAYGAAKARLFAWQSLRACVVNADDAFGLELARRARPDVRLVLTTRSEANSPPHSLERHAWVRADSATPGPDGLAIEVSSSFGAAQLGTQLVGDFNVENALTALAILLAWDTPLQAAAAALSGCVAPPGRMETFGAAGAPLAIVDFAHTPDALRKALAAARAHCAGRLWAVFGCGGERDRGKRPLMGQVAAELADEIVVTDDNPRGESPAQIVADILQGVPACARLRVVHERAQAIRDALAAARPDDVLLIAGKGHEDYQIFGAERRAYSDRDVVRRALAERTT
ncbi:MAG: UDP-N-acetylmuramoyl-L-alanyl-D-glutamate--2,6-diaminopimelate ligase, partial [Steroidobacteraceae bacterium]